MTVRPTTAIRRFKMGLIDDIRKKRDSWMARFEEHRQDESEKEEYSDIDREREEEEILRKRKTVGIFPKKEEIKK
jgi:hypothetical protein